MLEQRPLVGRPRNLAQHRDKLSGPGDVASGEYSDSHPLTTMGRIGVLLINVGTPEALSYWAMRRYLKEFLSDRRVVNAHGPVWWFVLNALILTRKPSHSAEAYSKIWDKQLDESPLKTITRRQAERVGSALGASSADTQIEVAWAMRYGEPAIGPALVRLQKRGCDRILLFPLYPQYSSATTATALDKAFEALRGMCWQPAVRTMPAYYDQPCYIDAVAGSLYAHIKTLSFEPEKVLLSFHGLPREFLAMGDPYVCQCEETAQLLRPVLGIDPDRVLLTFQSQTGRKEWHTPFTDQTVIELAQSGVKNLVVVTPGFAADCIETLEEIAIRARDSFLQHGGENFSFVPSLNDSDQSVEMLNALIAGQLRGWL